MEPIILWNRFKFFDAINKKTKKTYSWPHTISTFWGLSALGTESTFSHSTWLANRCDNSSSMSVEWLPFKTGHKYRLLQTCRDNSNIWNPNILMVNIIRREGGKNVHLDCLNFLPHSTMGHHQQTECSRDLPSPIVNSTSHTIECEWWITCASILYIHLLQPKMGWIVVLGEGYN